VSISKFCKSEDDVISAIPSASTGIGVTMSQICNTFLWRDGGNTVVGGINMTKRKITHLGEPAKTLILFVWQPHGWIKNLQNYKIPSSIKSLNITLH
jgi:hypothetical protein